MEKQLDEQLSLQIIKEAIDNAKSNLKDNGFFYLLWGWLVLIASLLEFGLIRFSDTPYHWVGWPVLMTAGALISGIYGYRLGKRSSHKTHLDVAMIYLWYGFLVVIGILLFMAGTKVITFNLMNALIIVMYGLGTFVSGGILKYKPLIIGGIAAWVISIFSFLIIPWYPEHLEYQLLMMALAIIVSYLIPGYMLKRRSNGHV